MSKIIDNINDIETIVDKQDTLVSGTNIKTVNGVSVLGSGDISINSDPYSVGDIVISKDITKYANPEWLLCDGSLIDEFVYPELATMLSRPNPSTKLANPATLPTDIGRGVSWSADGTYMSVAHSVSPFITIYKRSGDTFTKLANPSILPTDTGYGVSWSSDGTYMSVAHATAPYVTIYKRRGDVFTKLADPATLPTGIGQGVSWSSDGVYMSVAHSTTPFITIYKGSLQKATPQIQGIVAEPAYIKTGVTV